MKKALIGMVHGIAVCLLFSGMALCQEASSEVDGQKIAINDREAVAPEHPLMPVIRWAEKERPGVAALKDYTATLTKQENINGELHEAQVMEIKIRHEPFSVYIKYVYPQAKKGQQAIFIKGQNDDKIKGHGVGIERRLGTLNLDPDGIIAMRGNKYPITEIGVLNLIDKLLEVGYQDSKFGECTVNYTENGVKINGRECIMIHVEHPNPRQNFRFHIARIFVDKELNMPIRYESYDWPRKEGESPKLLESYMYTNLKINAGLTDADFDYTNPAYDYPGVK
jgi:hypothetical protein